VLVGFGNKLLDVDRHLSRLRRSAAEIEMEIPWSDEELSFELSAIAEQIKSAKRYVRLVVTRGNGIGLHPPQNAVPNKVIYAYEAAQEPREVYKNGIALKRRLLSGTRRGPIAKTGNYLRSVLALKQAQKEGFQDVLWTNSEGELTEASTANIFLLCRQGDLVEIATPSSNSGLLLGITRETLINIFNMSQIPVTQRIIYTDEIPRFDEAFLCSTVRGIIPVNRIDAHTLHTTRPNSVYFNLERLFFAWVQSQLGYKVDWINGKKL